MANDFAYPASRRGVIAALALSPATALLPASRAIAATVRPTDSPSARSIEARLGDRISVKDFGAVGNGITDDTAAVTAAIAAANGKRLLFPAGDYVISKPIMIDKPISAIALEGEAAIRSSHLTYTGSGTMLTANSYLDAFEIRNLHFRNVGAGAIALQINCVRTRVLGCSSVPVVPWSDCVVSTYQVGDYVYNTLLRDCYFDNFHHKAPLNLSTAIKLARGHTTVIDKCMLTGFNRGITMKTGGNGALSGLSIVNSRIEAFSNTFPYAGGDDAIGLYVDGVSGLFVGGCNFEMVGDQVASATAHRAIVLVDCWGGAITGCHIAGNGVATGGIEIASRKVRNVVISGNYFHRMNGDGVIASGTGTLASCEIGTNDRDRGTRRIFDNSIMPELSFGGRTEGISYVRRRGQWQRTGNRIHFDIGLTLAAKGKSTGNARIAGLPAASLSAAQGGGNAALSIRSLGLDGLGATQIFAEIIAGEPSVRLRRADTGAVLTDSDFTAASDILVSGSYAISD